MLSSGSCVCVHMYVVCLLVGSGGLTRTRKCGRHKTLYAQDKESSDYRRTALILNVWGQKGFEV